MRNFRAGQKPTFACITCNRLTRDTGDGVDHLCHQCFEIAGLDNQVNDSGEPCPADVLAICEDHLDRIDRLGGSVLSVRQANQFIWSTEKSDEPVAPQAQIEDVKPIETTSTNQPARSKKMSKRALTKTQKAVNLVAKFDGKIKPGELVAKIIATCKFTNERTARRYLGLARAKVKAGAAVTPARKRSAKKDVEQVAA